MTNETEVQTGISQGESPKFSTMDFKAFERLSRDLFEEEPTIATCEIYGDPGESQDGIDLLAHRADGFGIEVAQCKCYSLFPPANIIAASDEFFKYWDSRWSKEKVKRFVLFVGCDMSTRQRQDEILVQRKRFAKHKIQYEVWSASTIRNKLRPYPAIVTTHLYPAEIWLRDICGQGPLMTPISQAPTTNYVDVAIANQFEQLAKGLSLETERKYSEVRDAWMAGEAGPAMTWVQELKSNATIWPFLTPSLQAKVFRFEASLILDSKGDIEKTVGLADAALKVYPEDDQTILRALIAFKTSGQADALKLIENPKNTDEINLRASLLLETGAKDDCWVEINKIFEPNADTYRIKAFLYLAQRDIAQAKLEAQKALEMQPSWQSIRYVAAVVHYYSTISPVALPDQVMSWPEPTDWMLLKRDDESLIVLRDAEKVFTQLAQGSNGKHRYQAWRLACLANDPDRQNEAIQYCEKLLNEEPVHHQAIMWAVARNFGLDLSHSIQALEMIPEMEMNISQIVSLSGCYLASEESEKAEQLLRRQETIFTQAKLVALWSFWLAQSLVLNDKQEEALVFINDSPYKDELTHPITMAMEQIAEKNGDYSQLIAYLEERFGTSSDVQFLYQACKFKAKESDWAYIAQHAETIISEMQTPEVFQFLAFAVYNDKKYFQCLDFLDRYRTLFRGDKLPNMLRRLRVECMKNTGTLSAAVQEAEMLATEEQTTDNLLHLAHLYMVKGDLKALDIICRKIKEKADVPTERLLWLSNIVILEDRPLAIVLWEKAFSQGFSDSQIGTAISIGHKLGIDEEKLAPLIHRLCELGQKEESGIRRATIDDYKEFHQARQEETFRVLTAYREGRIPIHFATFGNVFPSFYHFNLRNNASVSNALNKEILFSRHGSRAIDYAIDIQAAQQWRLNLDISALMLAEHFGILDKVEGAFQELRLPDSVIPSLLAMQQALIHHQVSQISSAQDVSVFLNDSKLSAIEYSEIHEPSNIVLEVGSDWLGLYSKAKENDGYMVTFLPVSKRDLTGNASILPENWNEVVISSRSIVDACFQENVISEDEYNDYLRRLGLIELEPSTMPRLGAKLFLDGTMPEVLSQAGLLPLICEHFEVYIEKQEAERIKFVLKVEEQKNEIFQWLGHLIDRLRNGIDTSKYNIIPSIVDDDDRLEKIDEIPTSLLTLLKCDVTANDVLWIDDRYVNSYLTRDGIPIIGINEILKILLNSGFISETEYYALLINMRDANLKFIDFTSDEILYHLRRVRIANNEVVESKELKVVRRYIASCMLQADLLQKPFNQPDGTMNFAESRFLIGLPRAIIDSLLGLWVEGSDQQSRYNRADWIFENLYFPHSCIFDFTAVPDAVRNDMYLTAVSLASPLAQALKIEAKHVKQGLRKDYLKWLDERYISKLFKAQPSLAMPVVNIFKQTVITTLEKEESFENTSIPDNIEFNLVWKHVLQSFYKDLPVSIKKELEKDSDFTVQIGVQVFQDVVGIGELMFKAEVFWIGAAEAIRGYLKSPSSGRPLRHCAAHLRHVL